MNTNSIILSIAVLLTPMSGCFSNFPVLEAIKQMPRDGVNFALIKGALQGVKAYLYTVKRGTKPQTKKIIMANAAPVLEAINRNELFENCCDCAINLALDRIIKKSLCSGRDERHFADYHKVISLALIQIAKTFATNPTFFSKKTGKQGFIKFGRKLLEKKGAINSNYAKTLATIQSVALAAASLNDIFYQDLEAGTIDKAELKKSLTTLHGGKYRTLQTGAQALAIDIFYTKIQQSLRKQSFKNNYCSAEVLQRFFSDLALTIAKPYLKYAIAWTAYQWNQKPTVAAAAP